MAADSGRTACKTEPTSLSFRRCGIDPDRRGGRGLLSIARHRTPTHRTHRAAPLRAELLWPECKMKAGDIPKADRVDPNSRVCDAVKELRISRRWPSVLLFAPCSPRGS